MQAIEMTIPASAQRGRSTRIASIALTVTALVLAIGGTVALAANVLRDGDGYFNWPTEAFTSSGYAIAMKSVDISKAPQWAFGSAGLDSVRVKARSDRPLFIGIARAADLARYLRSTEHDEVSGLSYHPPVPGRLRPRRRPRTQPRPGRRPVLGQVDQRRRKRPARLEATVRQLARRRHERRRVARRHRPAPARRPHVAALVARRRSPRCWRFGRGGSGRAVPPRTRLTAATRWGSRSGGFPSVPCRACRAYAQLSRTSATPRLQDFRDGASRTRTGGPMPQRPA
jgi:hypothetical protein